VAEDYVRCAGEAEGVALDCDAFSGGGLTGECDVVGVDGEARGRGD
jgi:hypothetical protein